MVRRYPTQRCLPRNARMSFTRRLEGMLLQRIFYDEAGGKRGSRERLFEDRMQKVDMRPTAIRNWVNGVMRELLGRSISIEYTYS